MTDYIVNAINRAQQKLDEIVTLDTVKEKLSRLQDRAVNLLETPPIGTFGAVGVVGTRLLMPLLSCPLMVVKNTAFGLVVTHKVYRFCTGRQAPPTLARIHNATCDFLTGSAFSACSFCSNPMIALAGLQMQYFKI